MPIRSVHAISMGIAFAWPILMGSVASAQPFTGCYSAWQDGIESSAPGHIAACRRASASCRREDQLYVMGANALAVRRYGLDHVRSMPDACAIWADFYLEFPACDGAIEAADQMAAIGISTWAAQCNRCPADGWYEGWRATFGDRALPPELLRCREEIVATDRDGAWSADPGGAHPDPDLNLPQGYDPDSECFPLCDFGTPVPPPPGGSPLDALGEPEIKMGSDRVGAQIRPRPDLSEPAASDLDIVVPFYDLGVSAGAYGTDLGQPGRRLDLQLCVGECARRPGEPPPDLPDVSGSPVPPGIR